MKNSRGVLVLFFLAVAITAIAGYVVPGDFAPSSAPTGGTDITGKLDKIMQTDLNTNGYFINGDADDEGLFMDAYGNASVSRGLYGKYLDVDVSTTTFPAFRKGRLFWDDNSKTLGVYPDIDGPVLQIGQEQWIYAFNNTVATITDGQVVTINSAIAGVVPRATLAKADASSTACVMAMATHEVSPGAFGYFTSAGLVRGINTTMFSAGSDLFLSAGTAGSVTTSIPASPNCVVKVGRVVVSAVSGVIFVHPDTSGALQRAQFTSAVNITGQLTHGVVYDDVLVTAASVNLTGAPAPAGVDSTNDYGALVFSGSSINDIAFIIQMPHRYKNGTDVEPHFHYRSLQTGSVATACFQLWYKLATPLGSYPDDYSVSGATFALTLATGTHNMAVFPNITMAGMGDSTVILCLLRRLGNNASDTSSADVLVHSIDFHYQTEAPGSVNIHGD